MSTLLYSDADRKTFALFVTGTETADLVGSGGVAHEVPMTSADIAWALLRGDLILSDDQPTGTGAPQYGTMEQTRRAAEMHLDYAKMGRCPLADASAHLERKVRHLRTLTDEQMIDVRAYSVEQMYGDPKPVVLPSETLPDCLADLVGLMDEAGISPAKRIYYAHSAAGKPNLTQRLTAKDHAAVKRSLERKIRIDALPPLTDAELRGDGEDWTRAPLKLAA